MQCLLVKKVTPGRLQQGRDQLPILLCRKRFHNQLTGPLSIIPIYFFPFNFKKISVCMKICFHVLAVNAFTCHLSLGPFDGSLKSQTKEARGLADLTDYIRVVWRKGTVGLETRLSSKSDPTSACMCFTLGHWVTDFKQIPCVNLEPGLEP